MASGGRPAAAIPASRRLSALARLCRLLAGSVAFYHLPTPALAQQAPDLPLPHTDFGTLGLIEMPSARMAEDGTVSAGASFMKNTQHYNLGFQILPWLESSFRYSGLADFSPGYPVYWDRSIGVKLRLMEESDVRPALALGINDVVGTGIYGGEYLVASKQFGDFDASLGIGWGRLGSVDTFKNPFGLIDSSFKQNRAGIFTPGGTGIFNTLFHGEYSGLFGGVTWRTPIDGLALIAEYSSDAYRFEDQQGSFHPKNQMNYGLAYQLTDGVQAHLAYMYGTSLGGGLTFDLDPTKPQFPARIGAPMPQPVIRDRTAQEDALRALVGQRNASYAVRQAEARTRNSFVDELLANRAVGDLQLNGHTLTIAMIGTANPQFICHRASNAAAGSGTGISDITVRRADGNIAARCTVPRLLQASASLSELPRMPVLDLNPYQPLVIDATEATPAADQRSAERRFRADAKKQKIEILALAFTETEAIVYYSNSRYEREADAIERLTRLLMADAPTRIEKFRLISVRDGVAQQEFHILRTPLERAMDADDPSASIFDSPVSIAAAAVDNPILTSQTRKNYPAFDWDIFPQFRQQFFDPSNPLGVQFVGVLEESVELAPGLSIWAELEGNIFDTFNTKRLSDSLLPHVRTDFVHYFTEGKNGIGAIQANYRTKLTPELYAIARGGYLESMFAGVGGEVLYRPEGARWAVGADMYEVWQRNFDRLFGLQPYHVATGHITFYWDSPFWDLNFQARAGQYLAGDRGLTLQVTRRFATGVEIGAFFTKTNVSAQQFGEGSFDKGIIIRIPLDWVAPINTQSQIALDLRPVQRDGGQTLLGDATLYQETRRASESELVRTGANMVDDW